MSADAVHRALGVLDRAPKAVHQFKGETVVFSARVPKEVRAAFEFIARERDITASDVLREVMRFYLEQRV